MHEITPTLTPSARGELEITDAIQGLIDAGLDVRAQTIGDDWIDTGKKDDMLEANRLILGSLQRRIDGYVDTESTLIGPVVVEMGASVAASTVRGPAVIGPGTSVRDSYIGPFTAIGPDCQLVRLRDRALDCAGGQHHPQRRAAHRRLAHWPRSRRRTIPTAPTGDPPAAGRPFTGRRCLTCRSRRVIDWASAYS